MTSLRICMQNIRKWGSNSRIKMCLVLAVMFVYIYTKGIAALCVYMGQDMSPWIFPFLFSYRYMKIVFMTPVIFIFCDAPFVDSNQMYVMLRTKRKTWCFGQLLYIFAGSFIYVLVLFLSTIVIHIPHMQWTTGWGKVLGAAGTSNALTSLGLNYTTVKVTKSVILYFSPAQAMLFSFLLMWLSFVFTGLVIYVINVITKTRTAGVFAAGFLVLLTAVVDGSPRGTWFSPISWNSLSKIDVAGMTLYPTIQYVLAMYVGMICVLVALAVVFGKKQEIVIQEGR